MKMMDAMKDTIAAIVSLTAPTTLINAQVDTQVRQE